MTVDTMERSVRGAAAGPNHVPTLHGDGLTLRAFIDADAEAFVRAARESVGTVGRWLSWCHAGYTEAEALDWFALARSQASVGAAHEFGVFDADSGAFVGGAGLNLIEVGHRYCNVGYWVRESCQGRGIATRAVKALLPHAFGPLGLRRVEVVIAVNNAASAGVARRSGALFEGVARNRIVIDERSLDALVFSFVPASGT